MSDELVPTEVIDNMSAELAYLRDENKQLATVRQIMTTFNGSWTQGSGMDYLIAMQSTLKYINEALGNKS